MKKEEDAEARRFVDAANPHSWLLVAENLHDQAVELRRQHPGILRQVDAQGRVVGEWPNNNRSIFLLAASR